MPCLLYEMSVSAARHDLWRLTLKSTVLVDTPHRDLQIKELVSELSGRRTRLENLEGEGRCALNWEER